MIVFSSTRELWIRPMKSAPSACSAFISGEARARHRLAVVVPELGDAVDLDADRRDVRGPALVDDVGLDVAAEPRHLQRERCVDLEPVPDELLSMSIENTKLLFMRAHPPVGR